VSDRNYFAFRVEYTFVFGVSRFWMSERAVPEVSQAVGQRVTVTVEFALNCRDTN